MLKQPSDNLPLTIMVLKEWSMIEFTGIDILKYLQGQLTCNINDIAKNQYIFSSYCNPMGKVISNMYLFSCNTGIKCIQRISTAKKQIELMKKYSIFSKINITINTNNIFLGIAGKQAKEKLSSLFNILPNNKQNLTFYNTCIILHFNFPIERFLLITTKKLKNFLIKKLKNEIIIRNDNLWNILDIEAEYPIINNKTSELFLPQETNILNFNAVSFNKGCYIGQEIITKIQTKGINKRKLYRLNGNISKMPTSGEKIEYKRNKDNKWVIAGTILMACKYTKQITWIQAILNKNLDLHTQFRLYNSKINDQIFFSSRYRSINNNITKQYLNTK